MRIMIVLALSTVMTSGITAQQKEVLKVPGAVAGLPFSPAIRVGNIIYLSGQLGNKMGTRELVARRDRGRNPSNAGEHQDGCGSSGQLDGQGLQVHGLPGRHRGLREDERGLRDLLPEGSAGSIRRLRAVDWR